MTAPTILVVDDEGAIRQTFRALLERGEGYRVAVAENGEEALTLARSLRPDLILSDIEMPGLDGFELCRAVKADPELAGTLFVVVTGHGGAARRIEGLNLGVDDYLTKPVDAAELLARARAMLRLKRLHDELRNDKLELDRLHADLAASFDQLVQLLVGMVDLARPGAGARGRRLADAALALAARFEVPGQFLRDLEVAAQLREIGLVVDTPAKAPEGPDDSRWRAALVSKAVLEQVERLRGPAELIGAIHEHWDGSGVPGHLQRGEIPFRSRILRVLIDFADALERAAGPADPIAVAAALSEHAGTWYDPAVVTQLGALLGAAPDLAQQSLTLALPVSELAEGMVLAEDLCTSSGIKLLARGARITRGTLDTILRRQAHDPIIAGAWVARTSPAG